jgi:hypothetical protein
MAPIPDGASVSRSRRESLKREQNSRQDTDNGLTSRPISGWLIAALRRPGAAEMERQID